MPTAADERTNHAVTDYSSMPHDAPAPLDPLAGLTEPQRQAVSHTEGPLLVLAGPGSGKTRVITRRIANLIACGIPSWQILALTFTNKAAAEMRERVIHMLGEGNISRGLTVTTFHSLCARLLRRFAPEAGLPGLTANFTIYDTADQTTIIKSAIEKLNVSTSNFPPRSVLSAISSAKNDLLDEQAYAAQAGDFYARTIAKLYVAYQQGLRAADACDFDDLLVLTAKMLRENASVREQCRSRWQYLLIDEYQDTNKAQFVIASLLAGTGGSGRGGPNICVVGDPDQSIYRWRGADIENILQFEQVYPGARVIALGENFRSTKRIIATADTLIKNNTQRKHKPLFTANEEGEKIEAIACRDEHHEAMLVADWLRARKEEAVAVGGWKDMAVFYRTNALSRVLEDEMRRQGIPYVIARGTAFYQREEVKNALAYLRVVANPSDDASLRRIINTPARGIGATTIARLENAAAEAIREDGTRGVPLLAAMRHIAQLAPDIAARTQNAVVKFVEMIDGWCGVSRPENTDVAVEDDGGMFGGESDEPRDEAVPAQTSEDVEGALPQLVERVIRESGLEKMYKPTSETEQERLENLAELVSSARDFEDEYNPEADPGMPPMQNGVQSDQTPRLLAMLRAYLEQVTLVADADAVDPSQGAVTLMTLHAAKGLEFPAAVVVGLEENVLPHTRAGENPLDLEEERRLFFVGITRAMKRLLLTCARYRAVRGMSERTIPSRFLDELPREHVTFVDAAGNGGGAGPGYDPDWDDEPSWGGGGGHSAYTTHSVTGGGGGMAGDPLERLAARRRSAERADQNRSVGGLSVNDTVRHPQFGVGKIEAITGRGSGDARAQVRFRDVGLKTLVLQYARLEKIG